MLWLTIKRKLLYILLVIYPLNLNAEYRVVVHPTVEINQISERQLARIFALQQKFWPSGTPIKIISLPSNNIQHKKFVREKIKHQPHQLDRLWNRLQFTGLGKPPKRVSDFQMMLKEIRKEPSSIGYIDLSSVGETDGVKVLKVKP